MLLKVITALLSAFVLLAGCSTAPLADFLDYARPARSGSLLDSANVPPPAPGAIPAPVPPMAPLPPGSLPIAPNPPVAVPPPPL